MTENVSSDNTIPSWGIFTTHHVGIIIHEVGENVFGAELAMHLDDGNPVNPNPTDQKWISVLTDIVGSTFEDCVCSAANVFGKMFYNLSDTVILMKDHQIKDTFSLTEVINRKESESNES